MLQASLGDVARLSQNSSSGGDKKTAIFLPSELMLRLAQERNSSWSPRFQAAVGLGGPLPLLTVTHSEP